MFNMKTSDLFKRAKQLADLEGSDFISWNEAISCINESNVGLYEKLINMGDNSFVKSYRTTKEEEELPSDFWQLKGVFLWNNGNLQTINRRADNNGTHHLSYELRNGKLYLFGKPNDVLVEYFPKPEKLFFKPHDVAISLDATSVCLDCHKHTFLCETEDEEEHETLSIIDLDGIKTSKDFMQIAHTDIVRAYITENFVFVITENDMIIYDIMSGYSATVTGYVPLITESGKEFVIDTEGYDYVKGYTDAGYTVFVLTYRTPNDGHKHADLVPLQDAQRAMRVIRANADKFGVAAFGVGVMGSSAGGHVAASLMTRYKEETYKALDSIDKDAKGEWVSARPAFQILVYPVITMQDNGTHAGSRKALLGEKPSQKEKDAASCRSHTAVTCT